MKHSVFTWSRREIQDSASKYPWLKVQLCTFHGRPLADHAELRIAATYDEDGNHKTFDILNCETESVADG